MLFIWFGMVPTEVWLLLALLVVAFLFFNRRARAARKGIVDVTTGRGPVDIHETPGGQVLMGDLAGQVPMHEDGIDLDEIRAMPEAERAAFKKRYGMFPYGGGNEK